MLPATKVLRPEALKRWPVRLVVVVFPFAPVMATIGALQNHELISISEKTGIPLREAWRMRLALEGSPGLTAKYSASSARGVWPPNSYVTPISSSAASMPGEAGALSVKKTFAPARTSRRDAARPLRAPPTTVNRFPLSSVGDIQQLLYNSLRITLADTQ